MSHTGGCWPTEQQGLLLKAALLQGPESILSWETWIACTDINAIDMGSQRLLPLLIMNLRSQGVTHPILSKFKGVYRKTWYRNQMLLSEMAPVTLSFQEAGIETMVLKGAAMVVAYYKDPGLRPMDDFDLLVPARKIIPAIDQLRKLMWYPKNRLDKLNEINLPYQRAFHFVSRSGNQLDLHRHILFESPEPDADQDFWQAAIPVRIGNAPALALNPTDQLLHTCVHGLMWNQVPSLRWVADALMIVRTPPPIDWERLIFQSQKWEVLLTMQEALQYLSRQMHAPIPPAVLDRVQAIPITHRDRMEYETFSQSFGVIGNLPRRWYVYSYHYGRTSGWLRRLWGFPRFLQHFWRLDGLWLVPFYALGRGIRRLGKRLFGLAFD